MITDWLDVVTKDPDVSTRVGAEGIATGLEFLTDTFSKGALNLGVKVASGGVAMGYAVAPGVSPRLKQEFVTFGAHMLFSVARLKPADFFELRTSILDTAAGIQAGDWYKVGLANLRGVAELQAIPRAFAPPAVEEVEKPKAPYTPAPVPEPKRSSPEEKLEERMPYGAEIDRGRFRIQREPFGGLS